MANVVDGNPLYIDTEGIISTVPLVIKGILLKPNATGDAATFTYWRKEDSTITNGDKTNATTTVVASTGTITSSGNFLSANIDVNQIINIYATSSGKNIGWWQIKSDAGNDNEITVDLPAKVYPATVTMADDTSGNYNWKIWDARPFAIIRGSGLVGDTSLNYLDFENGIWVPNLAMHTLSASAVLYIYLKNR